MPDTNDHDLLIELRTEMRGLRLDVTNMSADYQDRVKELELTKFNSKDFSETWGRMVADHEARIRVQEATFTQETKKCIDGLTNDVESLQRFKSRILGQYSVAYIVGSALIAIITNIILKKYSP